MSRSYLENATWTGNKSVPTPFPVRLFLFACLHRGMPKLLLSLVFLFCLSFFFGEERFHLFSSPLILWTLLSYTIRLKIDWLIFDRLLNNNQLKNLPSGIFSSNTHLEWPYGCSRINTWTMKCPLKYVLVQENLFAK